MDTLKNLARLGLVVSSLMILAVAAFVFGYRAGDGNEGDAASAVSERPDRPDSQSVNTQVTRTTTIASPPPTLPTETSTRKPTINVTASTEVKVPTPTPTELPTATAAPSATVPSEQPEPGETENDPLALLEEVWQLLSREYYGDLPSPEDRTYGAIRGMLSTLDDDYTSFSEPTIAEILRTDASGSFEGIGAFVTLNEEDFLEIVQVFEGSPADQAGLQAGDQVVAVDGESIVGYGIYEAISLIRGPEGSQVLLTIQRDGLDPFDVGITRARLMIPITEAEMLENNVGYVSLAEFSSQAADRLEQELDGLIAQGATALIFDLRGNPGGFLGQAVDVADLFLDEGLVLIERRSDGEVREFESSSGSPAEAIPLAVLVNGGSASASEIVAGAIRDRARGTIIGETTLGKGSVQIVHTLSDGSELRVTFARWFTPNDHAIHGQGLVPDIEVVLTPQDAEEGLDPQLQRALEYLTTGK